MVRPAQIVIQLSASLTLATALLLNRRLIDLLLVDGVGRPLSFSVLIQVLAEKIGLGALVCELILRTNPLSALGVTYPLF